MLLTSIDLSFTVFTIVQPIAYALKSHKYPPRREGNLLGRLIFHSSEHIWISRATFLSLDGCLYKWNREKRGYARSDFSLPLVSLRSFLVSLVPAFKKLNAVQKYWAKWRYWASGEKPNTWCFSHGMHSVSAPRLLARVRMSTISNRKTYLERHKFQIT